MLHKLFVAVLVAVIGLLGGDPAPRQLPGWTTANLIANGGAELGPAAATESDVVRPAGWSTIGPFTAVSYGVEGLPSKMQGAAILGGKHVFAGGPENRASAAIQVAYIPRQWLPLVRQGRAYAKLLGSLGGWQTKPDAMTVSVRFVDANGVIWGNPLRLPPVTVLQRLNVTAFLPVSALVKVPAQTSYFRIRLDAIGSSGPYNTAFADNLDLYLVR